MRRRVRNNRDASRHQTLRVSTIRSLDLLSLRNLDDNLDAAFTDARSDAALHDPGAGVERWRRGGDLLLPLAPGRPAISRGTKELVEPEKATRRSRPSIASMMTPTSDHRYHPRVIGWRARSRLPAPEDLARALQCRSIIVLANPSAREPVVRRMCRTGVASTCRPPRAAGRPKPPQYAGVSRETAITPSQTDPVRMFHVKQQQRTVRDAHAARVARRTRVGSAMIPSPTVSTRTSVSL